MIKLPYILVFIDVLCAVQYGIKGDWVRVVYWLSAGLLTYSTVIMK